MLLIRTLLTLHLLGFASFLGGAFAQQQLMKASARAGLVAAVRDAYEQLAARVVTSVELPALFAQVATGVGLLLLTPGYLQLGWFHAKLTVAILLLGLSHVEMFNARRLVRARAARGDAAATEIDARKKRHAVLGAVGTVLVLALLGLVTFGPIL